MTARQTVSLPIELETVIRMMAVRFQRSISSVIAEALREYIIHHKDDEKYTTPKQ